MEGVVVHIVESKREAQASIGSAGLKSHVAGSAATVSALSSATGGTGSGNLVQSDV